MFIRLDEHRVTVHATDSAFRRKRALERVTNEEWVRIAKETAAVERRIARLQQVERTVFTR